MSKILELHFNPPKPPRYSFLRRNQVGSSFNTFCFYPQTKQEYQLGKLFIALDFNSQASATEPQNIEEVAEAIQETFYRSSEMSSEKAFERAIEQANQLLDGQTANFSALVLVIRPDLSFYFSKIGGLKIFLTRQKQLFDLTEDLKATNSNKNFPSLASGQLESGDKILILNQTILDFFNQNLILNHLVKIKRKKSLIKLFKDKKKILEKLIGFCLIISVKKEKRKIFVNLPQMTIQKSKIDQFFLALAKKILKTHSPALQARMAKSLLYGLILIILIILGLLLF